MLPHQKNKQTIDILRKLKQQGPPKAGMIPDISLDMTAGQDTGEAPPEPDMLVEELDLEQELPDGVRSKKKKPKY